MRGLDEDARMVLERNVDNLIEKPKETEEFRFALTLIAT